MPAQRKRRSSSPPRPGARQARVLAAGLGMLTVLASGSARADEPAGQEIQTSMAPSAGVGLRLPKGVGLAIQAQLRVPDLGTASQNKPGVALSGRVGVGISPILGLQAGYGFAQGRFPIDGAASAEHRLWLGAKVATPARDGQRFFVQNTLLVEGRVLDLTPAAASAEASRDWRFRVRPRNEVRLGMSWARWIATSLSAEALFEPQLETPDWLQLRAGVVLHGTIPLARQQERVEAGKARNFALQWLVGDIFAFRPFRMAKTRAAIRELGEEAGLSLPAARSHDGALHMMLTFGLSALI